MSKAKTIYRYSYVGEALKDTLEELAEKMELDQEMKEEIMVKFDEVIPPFLVFNPLPANQSGQLQHHFQHTKRPVFVQQLFGPVDRRNRK